MLGKSFRLTDQETTSLDPLIIESVAKVLYSIINVDIDVKISSYRLQISFSEYVPAILNSPLKFDKKSIITYK